MTMHRADHAEGDYVGTAFCEHDLLLILRSVGLPDPDLVVDDPRWVAWHGAAAHQWGSS